MGDVHGNFQATAQYYVPDTTIGAPNVPEKMLMNGFANIIYTTEFNSIPIKESRIRLFHNWFEVGMGVRF